MTNKNLIDAVEKANEPNQPSTEDLRVENLSDDDLDDVAGGGDCTGMGNCVGMKSALC